MPALLPGQDAPVPGQNAPAPRERPIVLEVGTVHPVSGPAIQNGVVVMRRGRIFNIGEAGKVRIPRNSITLSFPKGHAYPGLIDAMSTAYAKPRELADRSTNPGTDFFDALDSSDEDSRKLIEHGITTAYVSNRSSATWRGLGAILRPSATGFSSLKDKKHGGAQLRMTTGSASSHALDRLKQFDKTGDVFDSLESYEKQQKDYVKALADYEKKYKAYLEYHQKKNGVPSKPEAKPEADQDKAKATPTPKPAAKPAAKPTGTPAKEPAPVGRPSRRSGADGERGAERSRRRGTPTGGTGGRSARPSASASKSADKSKAPAKPKWPKKVAKDPAKEALLKVVNGSLPLRIEAHRKDEIRAAMFMVFNKELPGLTLEGATEGGEIAKEIAQSGAPVVITDLLPGSDTLTKDRDGSLPGTLHKAGVSVAIGSGTLGNAHNLTLMAAFAAGKGLPEDAAVRALTLTPAEILGVADQLGSLEKNKIADLIITSGPLLSSDTRILRVFSNGKLQYESK